MMKRSIRLIQHDDFGLAARFCGVENLDGQNNSIAVALARQALVDAFNLCCAFEEFRVMWLRATTLRCNENLVDGCGIQPHIPGA